MKTENYEKTYGVIEGFYKGKKRFFVRSDGSTTSLHYARYDFAMQQAENFIKHLYKNFTRTFINHPEFDTEVKFTYKKEVCMKKIKGDYMDIKRWAKEKDLELRKTINKYIADGWEIKTAVDAVLESSVIGEGYNAQIRWDYICKT